MPAHMSAARQCKYSLPDVFYNWIKTLKFVSNQFRLCRLFTQLEMFKVGLVFVTPRRPSLLGPGLTRAGLTPGELWRASVVTPTPGLMSRGHSIRHILGQRSENCANFHIFVSL